MASGEIRWTFVASIRTGTAAGVTQHREGAAATPGAQFGSGRMIAIRVTVSSSIANRGPSRPAPECLTPP
ncbi:hypothetical protein GCM10009545_42870 [Saccharopolyspora thermophila]|uniref:Uncharacterized protein n=1 Tax=Saccharopolyspora thermophila TaxID=89367 RepID=A0ABN1D6F1_9PSEU